MRIIIKDSKYYYIGEYLILDGYEFMLFAMLISFDGQIENNTKQI